ncbi:Crp/Fnr family transcriptional regulator [Jannaschia seohaensis]|uniref:CRP-like cAMP-binding protein n=1 Tax=Jannaschia seohaensis TaxID=475081 RepID=A0A2Y9AJJ3_9RHOB|nr:Crp/Fnr family transcriptional regulator [Jannaschia seohaensis]PWJ20578.1 CRP-like cAMP-binding protein [Jannaschia seohaensis]SSA44674.1 cAMP-binding domain of CRP or a regulatory subunit of cAMP-dependent protein kinases [Jannaschia seohaensis]
MIQGERNLYSARDGPSSSALETAAHCPDCHLRGAEFCEAICGEGASGAFPPPVRQYRKGRLILERGAPVGFLGVIRRGYACCAKMRVDGKRVLFGLAVPGDIVGGFPDQRSACDVEALTDLEFCIYEAPLLRRQLAGNARFRKMLLREIQSQHDRVLGGIWRYGTLSSRERIIVFLVMATEFLPTEPQPDGSLDLTMKIERRDWADLTNTALETISRTLRYLEEKALVTSLAQYRFRIHDLDRLALLAGVEPPRREVFAAERSESPCPPAGAKNSGWR